MPSIARALAGRQFTSHWARSKRPTPYIPLPLKSYRIVWWGEPTQKTQFLNLLPSCSREMAVLALVAFLLSIKIQLLRHPPLTWTKCLSCQMSTYEDILGHLISRPYDLICPFSLLVLDQRQELILPLSRGATLERAADSFALLERWMEGMGRLRAGCKN